MKRVSSLQNDLNFVERAQNLCLSELGYELPLHILEKAWVGSVDISALFAWCVFQSHQLTSNEFFNSDPIEDLKIVNMLNLFNLSFINVAFIF